MDSNLIKMRLHEELTKSQVQQELKDKMNSTEFKDKVNQLINQQIKSNVDLEKRIIDIAANVLTQMYKTLWTKRNFWR
jgi:hypothetical protein